MDKIVRNKLRQAIHVFNEVGAIDTVVGGVITSPFRPDFVYSNGLCINFIRGKEVCDPGRIADYDRAEVTYRTYERYACPAELLDLWRKGGAPNNYAMPSMRIRTGGRGFIPPVDTLVFRPGETHVISYDAPPDGLPRGITVNEFGVWAQTVYSCQGPSNVLFAEPGENAEAFQTAYSMAHGILVGAKLISNGGGPPVATSALRRMALKGKRAALREAVKDITLSAVYENTTLSLVMLALNVIVNTAR